jgi:hypothetical protein
MSTVEFNTAIDNINEIILRLNQLATVAARYQDRRDAEQLWEMSRELQTSVDTLREQCGLCGQIMARRAEESTQNMVRGMLTGIKMGKKKPSQK